MLLRHEAVAVRDILLRRVAHRVPPLPSSLGLESAGTVGMVEYPLAEAAGANADIEARRTTGSIVLMPPH